MLIAPDQRVILGPPGCGKTTTLLNLLEREMDDGTPPQRIAYFSFTRKAVQEAQTRATSRFDFANDDLMYFRTIHSMVFALNGHTKADVLGLQHYKEIGDTIGVAFGGGRFDESTGMPVGNEEGDTHLYIDSLARARRIDIEQQWRDSGIPDVDFRAVERTVAAVRRYKSMHGLVDFTDMLERYAESGHPIDVDVAFIDEAQDLSVLQWLVLRRLLSRCTRVYIAGDDDQAIYRWSGADVASFLALEGERRVLAQSYRCPQQVHRMADTLTARISRRFEKSWAPRDVAGRIVRVNMLEEFDFEQLEGSTLLLARNTYLLNGYYNALRLRGLTYRTSYGTHSVSRSDARAIYAWERLRKGESVSGADVKTIYDTLRVGVGVRRGHKSLNGVDSRDNFNMDTLRANHGLMAQGPWFEALDGIAGKDIAYYRSVLRARRSLLDDPSISVNTVHGVKGGEADNVMINPDMAWKSFKDFQKDGDDEHRVAYVAVSRSRNNLFVLRPQTKNFYPYLKE